MLEAALAAGVAQGGGDALMGRRPADPAARSSCVVSASTWRSSSRRRTTRGGQRDQVLRARRRKLSDEAEARIEAAVSRRNRRPPKAVGRARQPQGATRRLPPRARAAFSLDLYGLKVVLDCANGATTAPPPRSSSASGRDRGICADPTDATSTKAAAPPTPRRSPSRVTVGPQLGFAFDGDGDRVSRSTAPAGAGRRRADRRSRPATLRERASSAAASR